MNINLDRLRTRFVVKAEDFLEKYVTGDWFPQAGNQCFEYRKFARCE